MKCVTWSGTKPVLVAICGFLTSTSFYDLNADAAPTQQYPVPQLEYSPGSRSKGSDGGVRGVQQAERYSGGGVVAMQGDVYSGDSKVRYKSYETASSDNSMSAELNYKYGSVVSDYGMELSIPKRKYKDEVEEKDGVVKEVAPKRNLSEGAAKYVYEHKEAAARLAELTQGLYHEDTDVHEALHRDVAGKTFKEAFEGYDKGDVQEQVRKMINRICDTSKTNMELLVNAVQSIEGVDSDGNKHSDKFLKERKVKVSTKEHDYSFLFGGKKEVTPQDIVDCYKRLKNEIIEDANSNISTKQKEAQIAGLHELLAKSFDSYNESCNISVGSKKDNVFLNLKNMEELIEKEDRDMKEVIKHSNLPEKESEPSYHEVIRAFVGENTGMFPANLDEYLNAEEMINEKGKEEDGRKVYRKNTESLINHAADHPSLDMAAFLLSGASENTNSSGEKHSEAIYKYTFKTSDGYEMSIADAMEMAQGMPDSESRKRLLGDIIEKGIGGYYDKYNALGPLSKSKHGFHLSFDAEKLERDYQHESEVAWRKVNEAVKNNKKAKDNTSKD